MAVERVWEDKRVGAELLDGDRDFSAIARRNVTVYTVKVQLAAACMNSKLAAVYSLCLVYSHFIQTCKLTHHHISTNETPHNFVPFENACNLYTSFCMLT